jgi:anti-sigma factor RsiW
MNHELLHAYLDGEVTPDERVFVEQALASDSELAAEYARLVEADAVLGTALAPDPADSGLDFAKMAMARANRARRGRLVLLASAAAAAAAAILISVSLGAFETPSAEEDYFTVEEQVEYVYWETDGETYGSGDLNDLEDAILDCLETT